LRRRLQIGHGDRCGAGIAVLIDAKIRAAGEREESDRRPRNSDEVGPSDAAKKGAPEWRRSRHAVFLARDDRYLLARSGRRSDDAARTLCDARPWYKGGNGDAATSNPDPSDSRAWQSTPTFPTTSSGPSSPITRSVSRSRARASPKA